MASHQYSLPNQGRRYQVRSCALPGTTVGRRHSLQRIARKSFDCSRLDRGLTTRTYGTIASNSPVFVNREIGQDFNLKPDAATVLTLGSRYSRYFGATDSWSWSAGAARYFPGGYVSYRFSAYDTSGLGHTTGHTIGAKLSDPYGATQAWVGFGSQLHDADWVSSPQKGKQTQVEVRRLQPISKGVALSIGAKQAWIKSMGPGTAELVSISDWNCIPR